MANIQTQSNKLWIVGGIGAVVIGASVWGITSRYKKVDATPVLPKELTVDGMKEQRGEPWRMRDTLREAMDREDLTEEQKRQIGTNMREVWRSMMRERVDEYYAATDEEKLAVLDRQIDQIEKFREGMESRQTERKKEGEQGREEREQLWRQTMRSQSKEDRKERSESRNPDEMARTMSYLGTMWARMAERGIKPPEGGPGRGGRGFFGGP